MTSNKQPLILLKDFSKEFGQINKNNIYIKEEKIYEDIDTLSCKEIDLTSINKNQPNSNNEDLVNSQMRKNKPAPIKIKFPMMGKVKLLNKSVDEERSESKLENHKISNLAKISSNQGKSSENVSAGNKSQQKKRTQAVTGVPFSELEKEMCLKPMQNGWKREVVYRNTFTGNVRSSDIYYHAPSGKKLRSRVEIGRFLNETGNTDLTIDNFSFSKFLVGAGEPYEIERSANTKAAENSPNKGPSAVSSVTKFSSKSQSKPHLSGSIKNTSSKNILAKEMPNCNSCSSAGTYKRKRMSSSQLESKSKFIKLRDRKSIHPPARYEVVEDSDDDKEDNKTSGSNTNSRRRTTSEDRNRPEEMVVEPDIYFDENLCEEDVRLNFPFGIDEGDDDQTIGSIPDLSLKGPLLSDENLPPIVDKRDSKSNFPLFQLNFEDLYNEDGGGGGTDEPNENQLSVSKNSSKIRVRPLNELCDTSTGSERQSSSINPVVMNFNVNANVQSYFPNCNAGLPSIPTIPIPHLSYSNSGSVPVFVSMPNYTHNNPVVSNNRLVRIPFRIPPHSNNEKGVPFQNGVPNFARVMTPITSNIIPNLGEGNTHFNNYNETLSTLSFGNPGRSSNYKHRPILPRSTCTMQGKTYEFVIGSNNTPVLRQISQNPIKNYS